MRKIRPRPPDCGNCASGSGTQRLLLDRAGTRAADGDQSEIIVEVAQFRKNGKAAERILALRVNIDHNCGNLLFPQVHRARSS